ncbi:hypothetical protein EYR36_000682 [Pleurotus pulmonarius]|nr:hypothetical protein EYR36_004701 [Pleurotus pulmonarius]KAF4578874.1 hypothetical protein EYR36_000682 [Pleurotus pulmonarius]
MPPRKRKASPSPSPAPSQPQSDASLPPESQLETQETQSQEASQSQSQILEQSQEESQTSTGNKRRKTTKTTATSSKSKTTTTKTTKATKASASTSTADTPNATLSIPSRTPNTLKIVSWNLCGWAACSKKGLLPYLAAESPDILVLTEHKLNSAPWPLFPDPTLAARYPHAYWAFADKKGYSGTVILSTVKPLSVSTTLPGHPDPAAVNGRIVTLEFPNTYLVGTYVVNAGEKLKTLDTKNEWNLHFTRYIRSLDACKPVIWTGDLNVAPTELDLANAKKNWNKSAGYTEAETSAYRRILEGEALDDGHLPPLPPVQATPLPPRSPPDGEADDAEDKGKEDIGEQGDGEKEKDEDEKKAVVFKDVWRDLHPMTQAYTYFSYRFNCRAKGIGWRLDMFVLSERIAARAKTCEIRQDVYGSDHVPLVLELEGEL